MKYIGIDIGATNLKAGLVDDAGQILAKQKMKIAQIETPDLLARHLARMTEELAAEVGVDLDEIFSIGVGVPGVVEIRSGSLQYSCNLPFRRVPLRRLFHKYMNKPLYLENDGNCAAVGEYYAGAGRRSKRFVTITLGTGIGGGIIHNGKIYHGSNGMAGEVGHMSIEYNGKGLLGAVCLCLGPQVADPAGDGGKSREHSAPGGGRKRRSCQRSIGLHRRSPRRPRRAIRVRRIHRLSVCGYSEFGEYFPAGHAGHRRRC